MKKIIGLMCLIAIVVGCAPAPKFESTNNKFTGISSCQLKNIDVKTKEGVWIRFDLIKGKAENKNADYFLAISESSLDHQDILADLNAFCVGEHLWLTFDDKSTTKLHSSVWGAQGENVSISGGLKDHISLNQDIINKIMNTSKIKFELSKCESLKKKYDSVSGTISEKNLKLIKTFFKEC